MLVASCQHNVCSTPGVPTAHGVTAGLLADQYYEPTELGGGGCQCWSVCQL